MARFLDSEGKALQEIFTHMKPTNGRWVLAVENPTTQPPTLEIYAGDKDQEFVDFRGEVSNIPDEWSIFYASLLFKTFDDPSTIEIGDDLLLLLSAELQPDAEERLLRRSTLESILESMGTKNGIQVRRTTPPTTNA